MDRFSVKYIMGTKKFIVKKMLAGEYLMAFYKLFFSHRTYLDRSLVK